ncbi:hypothetical protein EV356DRAFT_502049 [Viridothelium virens]|uniref:dual-specificity kinase n=1 Tax=Viridothelium virens TaxID=1048519 RepID=A0A6A6HNQ5_VIRVR|nr:hypothetical protein EV356DRAFT_502049 [Viridothelium virens]
MDSTQFGTRSTGFTPADDSGSGAEGPARKVGRFQKSTAENERPGRRQIGGLGTAKTGVEGNSALANRRRSTFREHKAPSGPRPLDQSASKRVISDISSLPSSNTSRTFLPNSSSEPFFSTRSKERENNPSYALNMESAKIEGSENDFSEFLPSINFDDLHTNLTNNDLQLSQFPAPGGGHRIMSELGPATAARQNGSHPEGAPAKPTSAAANTHPTRSSSLVQRFGRNGQKSSDNSMPPPTAPLSLRTRRQSQFPAPTPASPQQSNGSNTRAPRKSVGPVALTPAAAGKEGPRRTSPTKSTTSSTSLSRSASSSRATRRVTPGIASTEGEVPQEPRTPRNVKAKSIHSPPHQHLVNSFTPEPSRSGSIHNPQSPGRLQAQQRTQTPSSSANKRQSVHGHVGGLGARTISPTDTHRLKRLSMVQDPLAVPETPLTPLPDYPLPDFSFVDRLTGPSPSMIPRKSITPSSARATPDPNRKSNGFGVSLSSSSSVNSLRNSGQNRWSQNLSTSRLPTPKPRTVHSSAGVHETEEVPPVPAIPKAYESPKDVPEQPFFDHIHELSKANGSHEYSGPGTPSQEATQGLGTVEFDYAAFAEPPKTSDDSKRHRRGLTIGTGSDAEKPQPLQTNRRNLQPLRLPPLNLLPFGSSANNRFDTLPTPSDDLDDRITTPPPKRNVNKTPSTPMTASKAVFPRNEFTDDGLPPPINLRSNTSHFGISGGSTFNDEYTFQTGVPIMNGRQATTPFASSSLPKNGDGFGRMVSSPDAEADHSTLDVHHQDYPAPTTHPTQSNHRKDTAASMPDNQTSLSEQPESPPSGSSLRRKLSARWKRSSSKASHVAQNGDEARQLQQSKHNDMPPPKLPASATWSGPIDVNSSPASAAQQSLSARRRKSSATTLVSEPDAVRGPAARVPLSVSSASSEQTVGSHRAPSSSIWSLGSRKSINTLKARNLDFNLDKDDLAADEEMKKLASRRKDFEFAAREVDELRKRATPKERVSPAQALTMVNLNLFERGEIIDYREVFFCGTKSAKKVSGDLNAQSANFGYDDERGDYNIVYGDHLSYRYEVVDLLGKGSFGQVVRCVDHKTGQLVAVKIIRNKKRFHQQALVEVNILQKLREWDPHNRHSMINFTQSFYFRGHLCISTELLGMNLYEFIKAHDFKGFSLKLIRRFTKQMLSALVLLKSHRVIHCDLKPENILLAHPLHSEIKVIDFGSSCFENEKVYTYIQSRFYRSPEVILGMSYGLPIDMWSLGCILAELLTGYPIFPGENEQEQLACIMEIFGPPEKHLIEKSTRKKLFFDSMGKPRITVSSKGRRRRASSKTLQGTLKCDDDAFLDFLARCLRWDPDRRLKPDEALHHDFVTGVKRAPGGRSVTGPTTRSAAAAAQANAAATSSNSSLTTGASAVAASFPIKRVNSTQHHATPASSVRPRPLPEPPGTSFKTSAASPNKSAAAGAPRRHSTVNGMHGPGAGTKRASNGAVISGAGGMGGGPGGGGGVGGVAGASGSNSSLPRVAQRSTSGKPDLASAAAIASLRTR